MNCILRTKCVELKNSATDDSPADVCSDFEANVW